MTHRKRTSPPAFNLKAAEILRDCAELLRVQDANPFRVNAYNRAAETLESIAVDARDIIRDEGTDGLEKLPAIGHGLASAITEIACTGRLALLDRLRGTADPEALFRTVAGIGPSLAQRIHDELHIETLEALEIAAHDGTLTSLPGIGPRRAAAVRAGLAAILGRRSTRRGKPDRTPSVATLLSIDEAYRKQAAAGKLPRIAPKRFNPGAQAWLPIMHTDQGGWHFTALFSNTARAHDLGRTHDWVVLYFYDGDHREGQCTVVTETHGPLRGKRIVRGREAECRRLMLR